MSAHDQFTHIDTPDGTTMAACPVCGSVAQLWRRSESQDGPSHVAVCCTNGEIIGPQTGAMNEGCLLYMPPEDHYRATIREAVKYWNEFASAILARQRANRWKDAKVLRSAAQPKQVAE